MFTGLIEEVGTVVAADAGTGARELQITAPAIAPHVHLGESVAVNGCCLTISTLEKQVLGFDLLEETLQRTNLGALKPGSRVNLERALAAAARLGGHFVQGHVDCAVPTIALAEK